MSDSGKIFQSVFSLSFFYISLSLVEIKHMASLHNTNKTCTAMSSHNGWAVGLAAPLNFWLSFILIKVELPFGNMNQYFLHSFFFIYQRIRSSSSWSDGDQRGKNFPKMHCSFNTRRSSSLSTTLLIRM